MGVKVACSVAEISKEHNVCMEDADDLAISVWIVFWLVRNTPPSVNNHDIRLCLEANDVFIAADIVCRVLHPHCLMIVDPVVVELN